MIQGHTYNQPTRRAMWFVLPSLGLALAMNCSAQCETLADAIASAYSTNPSLISQRSQMQATDETYVQALAGFRPIINATLSTDYTRQNNPSFLGGRSTAATKTGSGGLSVSQPLYTGGRATAQVESADAGVLAAREQLRGVEQSVILAAIEAYADVTRDRAALTVQLASLQEVSSATNEIRARYEAGATTIVDLSQAQTQVEASKGLVESARAQLDVSVAEYVAAVGHSPASLAPVEKLPGEPADLDTAFDAAQTQNPLVTAAQFAERQAHAQVREARAEKRPSVALTRTLGYSLPVAPFDARDYNSAVEVTATLTQPIYAGGVLLSRVRQATALASSARTQVEVERRNVVQAVAQAWSQRRAAAANLISADAETKAAQATFDGMRIEYRAGLRQTLDVLTAQEELRAARLSLLQAEHDDFLQAAVLLQSIGRLEARRLISNQPIYDASAHLKLVERIGAEPIEIIPRILDRIIPSSKSPELSRPALPMQSSPVLNTASPQDKVTDR